MRLSAPAFLLALTPISAFALNINSGVKVDKLVSRRLHKRDVQDNNYNISIFHVNDVHAHLEEFAPAGTNCTNPSVGCLGGYARIKDTIDELRPGRENSLLLNMGDEFQVSYRIQFGWLEILTMK